MKKDEVKEVACGLIFLIGLGAIIFAAFCAEALLSAAKI